MLYTFKEYVRDVARVDYIVLRFRQIAAEHPDVLYEDQETTRLSIELRECIERMEAFERFPRPG